MNKRKGFTLIELLAVIVILGLLMAIAIPSVTKYITESRKKTVVSTIGNYITAMVNEVNDLTYTFTGSNTIYAVPIECIALERGGTNPFGAWHQASNAYWAYVLVQYDDETSSYRYGYTFKDSAGYGLYPTTQSKLNEGGKQIQTGLELTRPKTGKVTTITKVDNWSGFNVDSSTDLVVLNAESEGNPGNGETTCTLVQKGSNYDQVEEEKIIEMEKNEADDGTLINGQLNSTFGHTLDRNIIEEVRFLSNKRVPSNAIEWWDASVEQNKSIKAWTLDADSDGLVELYIGQKGGVTAPADCSMMFINFKKATIMDFNNFDTSEVTNMMGMFWSAESVLELDFSMLNLSKLTSMATMFFHCHSLVKVNFNNVDTSKVTNMYNMFNNADALTTIDLTGLDTNNVTNMSMMFANMDNLTTLNLSGFNTSKVTDISGMFWGSTALKSVNFSNWVTTNITDMAHMFTETTNLGNLDLSNFNTSNVTDMEAMFRKSGVKTLTLGTNFKTNKVTRMNYMFQEAPNVNTTIAIRNSSLEYYYNIFLNAATSSTAKIYVNYTSSTSAIVNDMLTYKSSNSKVYKGSRVY